MESEEERHFSVGELAQICGITVRTLQYYDRCGLLQASFTEGGRRVYSRNDLFNLQQILFLKSLGFSLEQIKGQVTSENNSKNIVKVFEKQYDILQAQMINLQKMLDTLEVAIKEAKEGQAVSLEKIMAILELMSEGNPYTFLLRYFSGEQIRILMERTPQVNQSFIDSISKLFSKLDQLYVRKVSPESPEAQDLAKEWWSVVRDFSEDNQEWLHTLILTGNDLDNWPKEAGNLKTMMRDFLSPALSLYFKRHDIHIDNLKGGII
ncbi:MAG: transcriptional regulator, MerR family [Bacteroidetes bacterium]|nr:transcriptional regulator, MerR family [Bacteroidota bacterium]